MTKKERKVSTTVYLTTEQRESLRDLSRETRVPTAVMIRYGIDVAIDYFKSISDMIRNAGGG